MTPKDPHNNQSIATTGAGLDEATSAMILIHGRGATARGILDLARVLPVDNMAYLAPQAANNAWYPYRFIAPVAQNEPWLSSGLSTIGRLMDKVTSAGIERTNLYLGGFSQGGCLVSEFVARNPTRYGGLFVFSGGLIGPPGELPVYEGDLAGTPVFMGCSDVDPHIPIDRFYESATIFEQLGASVTKKVYPGMGHTINTDEIREVQGMLEG